MTKILQNIRSRKKSMKLQQFKEQLLSSKTIENDDSMSDIYDVLCNISIASCYYING